MLPLFFGLSGPALTGAERAFFRAARPAGFILFQRNCVDLEQLRALTDSLRELDGRDDLPILIDQEGGRVARLRPPAWPEFPPPAVFGRLYARAPLSGIEAARVNARAIALTLAACGVTVDCLPLLDVPAADGHAIIGDRAYCDDPMWVAALGRATLDGLAEGGVVGVVKHIPGHGRATVDSHMELPVVTASADELERDLEPFASLKDAAMAMTAHVVYTAFDSDRCASTSPIVIAEVIRGRIGFDGLLMSDDLVMDALGGTQGERAAGVLAAGCDIALGGQLCDLPTMEAIAAAVPAITPIATARLTRAMGMRAASSGDFAALIAKRDALLALAA